MSVLIALSGAPLSPTAKINLLWKQKQVSEGGTRFPRMDQDWQSTYQYTEDSAFFFFFLPAFQNSWPHFISYLLLLC